MKKRIIVRGPALTQSGYGEHARFVLRSLRSREDLFDIYLQPISWGQTNWTWEDTEERRWLDSLVQKTAMYGRHGGIFDISVQVTIPNEWQKMAEKNIGITAGLEMSKVHPEWLIKSREVDKIITISEHSRDTYKNTVYSGTSKETGEPLELSCEAPIEIVRYPVKDIDPDENFKLELEHDRNFLTVAQWGPRKNVVNLVKWFVEEFADDEVGLILKLNKAKNCLLDQQFCLNSIRNAIGELLKDAKCSVYLLHGSLTEQQMTSLYVDDRVSAYVTATHGEGFGLPIYEAAYNGLPVIAPDWSGHVDFLRAPMKVKKRGKKTTKIRPAYARVDYKVQQIPPEVAWDKVVVPDCSWCVADEGSFKRQMRGVMNDLGRYNAQARKLQDHIEKEYSQEKQYAKMCIAIHDPSTERSWLDNVDNIIQEFE